MKHLRGEFEILRKLAKEMRQVVQNESKHRPLSEEGENRYGNIDLCRNNFYETVEMRKTVNVKCQSHTYNHRPII